MKILILTDRYPPFCVGGYEIRCKRIADSLREMNNEVMVLTTKYGSKGDEGEKGIYRILDFTHSNKLIYDRKVYLWTQLKRAVMFRKNSFIIKRNIRKLKPDIVYCFQMWDIGLLSITAIQENGIPMVFDIGDYWLSDFRTRFTRSTNAVQKFLTRLLHGICNFDTLTFDNIIVLSETLKKSYVNFGFNEKSITVIAGGVNLQEIPKPFKEKIKLDEQRYPIKGRQIKLFYAGRISPEKGVHTAIEAIKYLIERVPGFDIVLDIAGEGPKEYLRQLMKLIDDLKLSQNVNFLGKLNHYDVFGAYNDHDIVLFPSIWEEPFGFTVLEAMAFGIPVIASNLGGPSEVINDSESGMLVTPEDPIAIAEAAEKLIMNPKLYIKIKQEGVKTATEKYSYENQIQEVNKHLAEACEAHHRKSLTITIIAAGFQSHYVIDLVNALAENNIGVDFLGSDIYEKSNIKSNVNFVNIRGSHEEDVSAANKIIRMTKYYFRLFRYSMQTRNKVFHVQWLRFYFLDGVIVNLMLRIMGKKVVYTAHDVVPHFKDNIYNRIVFGIIYKIVDVIIAHTNFIKSRIVNEFKINENKIKLIKHGVYRSKDDFCVTKDFARVKLGLRQSDKVILFFGYITFYKGIDILVEAVKECSKHIESLKLIIAGKVGRDYREKFHSLISDKIIKKIITTKFGYVPDEEVELIFKASDVVILPYLEASQSGVMFLAYSYGKPVIVSNIGGFLDDVVNGETGYFFKKGDPSDLAEKIKLYFSGLWTKQNELEKSIKEISKERYAWFEIGKNLARIYSSTR